MGHEGDGLVDALVGVVLDHGTSVQFLPAELACSDGGEQDQLGAHDGAQDVPVDAHALQGPGLSSCHPELINKNTVIRTFSGGFKEISNLFQLFLTFGKGTLRPLTFGRPAFRSNAEMWASPDRFLTRQAAITLPKVVSEEHVFL